MITKLPSINFISAKTFTFQLTSPLISLHLSLHFFPHFTSPPTFSPHFTFHLIFFFTSFHLPPPHFISPPTSLLSLFHFLFHPTRHSSLNYIKLQYHNYITTASQLHHNYITITISQLHHFFGAMARTKQTNNALW